MNARPDLAFALAAVAGLAACSQSKNGPRTPEEAIAGAAPGALITVEGTAFAITFDNVRQGGDYPLVEDRWVLLRTVVPRGVAVGDLEFTQEEAAWGLGLHVTAAERAARKFRLPQTGDVVRATGTFQRGAWNGLTRPMLENLQELVVTRGEPPRADLGEACRVDMDCRDELVCDRAGARCATTPGPIEWRSAWHDLNGACDGDADCPSGQACDLGYAIVGTGEYRPPYIQGDVGRHLCVPAPGATLASLCPHIGSDGDLASGRYVQGKEICVRSQVIVGVEAEDRDTHVQMLVREPLPYPASTLAFAIGGAAENSPSYKDPARPGGALPNPMTRRDIVVTGTYRYDLGHGWFEIHPYKMWWPAP